MQFCPECDNLLLIKKDRKRDGRKTLACSSCGHEQPYDPETHKKDYMIETKLDRGIKDKTIVIVNPVNESITEEYRDANEWMFEHDDEEFG